MRKQTKKEIWYWMIMGASILTLLAFAYAGKGSKTKKKTNKDKKVAQQEATVKSEQEPGSSSEKQAQTTPAPQGGGQEPKYFRETSGGQLGQNYLLSDTAIQDYSKESWLLVFLKPNSYTKLPRYTGRLSGQKITVTLSDTADYDFTTGKSSYQGKYALNGKGVIKQARVIRSSGAQMTFELSLTKSARFKVNKILSPLRLVIKVEK